MKAKITNEKNIQMLISMLKEYGIKNIIVSPGTSNISFVATVQNDPFFNVYSCVDERSAAYMACGMASETGEPVVINCTGATASRNYVPGLTEAFYRKLPIIAITATQLLSRVGHNIPQVLDRSVQFNDLVKTSVQLTQINNSDDEWDMNLKLNNAFNLLKNNGGGPIHINMVTNYSNEFINGELPKEKIITRVTLNDKFPVLEKKKIAVFIGNHSVINSDLQNEIEMFCEKFDCVVLCDHTSNYHGKYKIIGNIVGSQSKKNDIINVDLLIDMGNISGAYMGIIPKEVWRVSPDGQMRDRYKKLKYVFEMEEIMFFKKYNENKKSLEKCNYYNEWKKQVESLYKKLDLNKLPFSNIWISNHIINKIPDKSTVHVAILNTLRSWNFFNTDKHLNVCSNTGGFGIDGILSTAIGSSLVTNKNVYCCIGDLAFFYDLNSLGNREIKNNLRILLINNGTGTEFHNYNNRAAVLLNNYNIESSFIAADGHFGNKSKTLVKHYAEDLGFDYISAHDKNEFIENIDKFINENNAKSVIFEVFTNYDDESKALEIINHLNGKGSRELLKNIAGEKAYNQIKKAIKK